MFRGMRFALRQLRNNPGFTITVVLTLALGIGSSSALFCLMDATWFRPAHVSHPGQLVRLFSTTPQDRSGSFSYFESQVIAQSVPALAGVAGVGARGSLMARPDGTSLMLETNVVTANFFELLGVRPAMGRLFQAGDAARLRSHPGVVLDYGCWQRRFGADPAIVGKLIPLRQGRDRIVEAEVWAVLPKGFRSLDPNDSHDLWMPAESWAMLRGEDDLTARGFRWFNLVGRLAPGATVEQAGRQIAVLASALERSDHANNHDRSARVVSDFGYRLEQAGRAGLILIAIVAGVVLLATVNVAHLLLARGLERGRELAVRLALGATRGVLLRQLLAENALLCALGLALGLALAAGLAALLPSLVVLDAAMLDAQPTALHLAIDWRVFLFSSALAAVTMLLLALVPVLQLAHPHLAQTMQAGGTGRSTARASSLRRAAIWLQIGVSFALLVSTGLLVRSFLNTRTRPIGLSRGQVLVAFTQLPDDPMLKTVVDRLRAVPGVSHVAWAIRSPLMPSENGIALQTILPSHPELHDPLSIKFNAVSPDFLQVSGTRLLRGRGFTTADDRGPMPVIVNQTMAAKFWPAADPLGQIAMLGRQRLQARVVGIAEDAPISRVGELPEPFLYVPFAQYVAQLDNMGEITFVLSTGPNAMSLAQPVRQALIAVDPLLDPMFVTSQPELIRSTAADYQVVAELVSALGLVGLALTAAGFYGFLAFRVTQRQREIGIRMALGATRQSTVALMARDTAALAGAGLLVGAVLAAGAVRLESSMLFGVQPLDPLSVCCALTAMAIAVLAAGWIPAHRAASVEPMQALRTE